ncbi:hypothetical protein NC651_004148 [Populus alba x Populus x berolinensis]|nr:hypothetical protein NC651_004148 [Populus alba x Populus x berolinensis]
MRKINCHHQVLSEVSLMVCILWRSTEGFDLS